MKSQLGVIKKMQSGGEIPVQINDDVISKITHNVGVKKLKKRFQGSSQGVEEVEHNYNLCFHDNFKDKLFVISQVRIFDGQRIVKDKFNSYCFDLSGNEIDFDLKDNYVDGFYENCYILKQLMN